MWRTVGAKVDSLAAQQEVQAVKLVEAVGRGGVDGGADCQVHLRQLLHHCHHLQPCQFCQPPQNATVLKGHTEGSRLLVVCWREICVEKIEPGVQDKSSMAFARLSLYAVTQWTP